MTVWHCGGSAASDYSAADVESILNSQVMPRLQGAKRVLLVPPDLTRAKSGAGEITALLCRLLGSDVFIRILPALGTHFPMSEDEIRRMFGLDIPLDWFLVHDWRNNLRHLGTVGEERIAELSEGRMKMPVEVEVDATVFDDYDAILSIGQIVPHEVVGMANYTKNICVGLGGSDIINKSHYLGAVYGMERMMGRSDTPVRHLFNGIARDYFQDLPITYIMTVMQELDRGAKVAMRGLFIGDSDDVFEAGAALSRRVNITDLPERVDKVVTWLDPEEFKSTWLGNKSVYRSRMAIADGGELVVLAPGLKTFGEDATVDRLVRKYGYRGTPAVLEAVEKDPEMRDNLSAAAHLIHGSSEGRFTITYCPGPNISAEEVRGVGFEVDDLASMLKRYNPEELNDGLNELSDGERVFFIRNPALGLWMAPK
jgi:nickel-dependent lactate racemase